MKRTILATALLAVCAVLFAQQPVITFEKTDHDFGKINEADGRVTTIFTFKNEGMAPLVLSNVRASCGCTTPTWTKTPIEPGQTGDITVTYNPNGRPGRFQKTITITSNASEPTKKLTIRGEVIPKTAQQAVNRFSQKMGDALAANSRILVYGTVLNTKNITKTIEYTNNSDKDITVEVLLNDKEPWIDAQVTLVTVKPKEVGQLHVNVDGTKAKIWGAQNSYIYLAVNGKRVMTDDYKVTLSYSIEEDFSGVDKKTAPILEVASRELMVGTIDAGSKVSKTITLKNAGANPLLVRAVSNNAQDIKVAAPKSAIKSGKGAALKVQIAAGQEVGTFRRQIDIITNDPANPHTRITIVWTVK